MLEKKPYLLIFKKIFRNSIHGHGKKSNSTEELMMERNCTLLHASLSSNPFSWVSDSIQFEFLFSRDFLQNSNQYVYFLFLFSQFKTLSNSPLFKRRILFTLSPAFSQ